MISKIAFYPGRSKLSMEFKNLERTRFSWFATKEIKNLDKVGDKLPFITKFSFGPFVPYYLYSLFHNLWDFLVLEIVAGTFFGMIAYIVILAKFLMTELNTSSVSNYDFSKGRDLYSGDSGFLTSQPYILIILGFLILIVVFGIKIYQGINSRRLSWNRCEWIDYESFEMGEKNWNIAGLVFFVLQIIFLLVVFTFLIFLYLNLAGAHY
jgi:hypothetical protein